MPTPARRVIYLAHPVAPTDAEVAEAAAMIRALEYDFGLGELRQLARRANVVRAQEILTALRREFPETVFAAPWIACLLHDGDAGDDDDDPAQREAGILDNEEIVRRFDGIVLTGVRLSSGMTREDDAGAVEASGEASGAAEIWRPDGFTSYDLVGVVTLATDVPTANRSLARFGPGRAGGPWPRLAGDVGDIVPASSPVTFDAWASGVGRVTRRGPRS